MPLKMIHVGQHDAFDSDVIVLTGDSAAIKEAARLLGEDDIDLIRGPGEQAFFDDDACPVCGEKDALLQASCCYNKCGAPS